MSSFPGACSGVDVRKYVPERWILSPITMWRRAEHTESGHMVWSIVVNSWILAYFTVSGHEMLVIELVVGG